MTASTPNTGAPMKDEAGLSAELMGCPFCDHRARMVWEPGTTKHRASCFSCGATFHWFATEPEAVAAWNTRSSGQKPFDDGVREKVARIVANAIFQSGYTGQPTVNGPCKDAASTIIALLDSPHDH